MLKLITSSFQQTSAIWSLATASSSAGNSPLPTNTVTKFEKEQRKVPLTKPSWDILEKNDNKIILSSVPTSYNASEVQGSFIDVAMSGTGQYVAAVSSNGVYISSDYGQEYTTATIPTNFTANGYIAIASNAPQYMLMGYDNGLLVSTNYGVSFSTMTTTSLPLIVGWVPVTITGDGQYAYVALTSGSSFIYSSTDYLSSFQVTDAPSDSYYYDVSISTDGSTLYAITYYTIYINYPLKSGSVWTALTVSSPYTYGYSVVATNSNGQYVAVLDRYGQHLCVSNNYGASGSWISTTAEPGYGFSSVSMSPSGQYMYVADESVGVFYSTNYGASLSLTQAPPTNYKSIAISTSATSAVAVSSEGSIYQTSDSGASWTPNHCDWMDVAMSQDGQTTFAVSGYASYGYGFMSTNGGSTWLQTGYSYYSNVQIAYTFVSCDSNCEHIAMVDSIASSIYITSDYGKSWNTMDFEQYLTGDEQAYALSGIAMSSTGQYMTTAMYNQYIFTSSDYGKHWQKVNVPPHVWRQCAMSSSGQYQAFAYSIAYYALEGGIYLSSDYGATWSIGNGTTTAFGWTSIASDATGMNLLTVSYMPRLAYYSNDYGVTWKNATVVPSEWVSCALSSSGQYMYVASRTGVVYTSTNFGVTWSHIVTAPVWTYKAIASDSTGQYLTLVALSGPILRSNDYGVTWNEQDAVFSTTNDFGTFDWNTSDDSNTALSIGAIIGIAVGAVVFCCCIAALIGYCVFGMSKKKSILQIGDPVSPLNNGLQMDKV